MSKKTREEAPLTMEEYQKGAMSTCLPESHNYVYMAEGLVGEMGELMSKVAKAVRKGKLTIYGNELSILGDSASVEDAIELFEGICAELGDILWFVAGLSDVLGRPLETIALNNLSKLRARKDNGTIIGNGDGTTTEERTN